MRWLIQTGPPGPDGVAPARLSWAVDPSTTEEGRALLADLERRGWKLVAVPDEQAHHPDGRKNAIRVDTGEHVRVGLTIAEQVVADPEILAAVDPGQRNALRALVEQHVGDDDRLAKVVDEPAFRALGTAADRAAIARRMRELMGG